MKIEKKKCFCSVRGVMGSQIDRGDERKMTSPGEGSGGEKIIKLFYRRDNWP